MPRASRRGISCLLYGVAQRVIKTLRKGGLEEVNLGEKQQKPCLCYRSEGFRLGEMIFFMWRSFLPDILVSVNIVNFIARPTDHATSN